MASATGSLMRALASSLVVVSLGCACGAPRPPPTSAPASVATAPLDYEVHEWGLVRAEPGDALRIGAIGPPVDTTPMVVLKPILYFHAATSGTLARVQVSAPAGGTLAEAWPQVPTGAQITWTDVALDPRGACTPSPLPGAGDPFCTALGDFCETAGLAVARTGDAACVRTAGTTEGFLFYRGRSTTLTPPLVFERLGDQGDARVTNESDAPIPGRLVRIWQSMGETRVSVVDPPPPGTSITVARPAVGAQLDMPAATPGPLEARAAIHDSLTGIGLSSAEADAFLRAWEPSLFSPSGSMATLSLAAPAPAESFVYFLPESATDAVATLDFDPPPRAVRRAIAVWSALAPSGPSH